MKRRTVRLVVRRKPRRKPERGAIFVVTALLLPILIGMLAMAIDVGYVYYRGLQLQRTADSAALAGVTRMPRFADAASVARDVAKRNGFESGQDGIVVTPAIPNNNNKRLKVTIRDNDVDSFFLPLFQDNWRMERTSVAEYVSNIPLGSVENAIGTGNLSSDGVSPQNFWLAVSGPCAAKEAGDQISSRYDGNWVNRSLNTGEAQKAYLCDVQTPTQITERRTLLAQRRATQETTTAGIFPAVSLNRDYDFKGYNYIVDIPCNPAVPGGESPPPPCTGGGQTLGQDLVIQVYDPVFNPDSIQRYAQQLVGVDGGAKYILTEERGNPLKPDKVGLARTLLPLDGTCYSANVASGGCTVVAGANNPTPDSVRVTTEFRLYPPDQSPIDYENDVAMALPLGDVWIASDSAPDEVGKVARFGSCQTYTDAWTALAPDGPDADLHPDSMMTVRDTSPADGIPDAPPAGFTADTLTTIPDGYDAVVCPQAASQWVTLATIPAGSERGRFRINVRTVDAPNSFGTNSFSLRAYFSSAAHPTFAQCNTTAAGSSLTCPATSGDTSMSVFANVNSTSRFYLARLSPPALYRNKTIIVQLWDPGEGADTIEVMRPIAAADTTCTTRDDAADGTDYCIQRFSWKVWNPGINVWSATWSPGALDDSAPAFTDDCYGMTVQENVTVLTVSGSAIPGCTASGSPSVPNRSRAGYSPTNKFNDRLVAIQIQIPKDYGCRSGTGTATVACDDLPADEVPESGWWKIRYKPTVVGGVAQRITDRTTWTVQLLGDPVHLVRE